MAFLGGTCQIILEAVLATARGRVVVGIEAICEAAFKGRARTGRVVLRPGAMGCFGVLGAVRGGVRADIVVQADRLQALAQLPLLQGGIPLGLDLSLALAIGGFGLLEDVDDVLGLLWRSVGTRTRRRGASSFMPGPLTLLTTLPDRLMTVMVSPTPMAERQKGVDGCWA